MKGLSQHIIAGAVMLAAALASIAPSNVKAGEVINIATGEWPPYLSESLPHEGYGSHLIREAFATVGVEVNFGYFPWKRTYNVAKQGKQWNGAILWLHTDERADSFLYTDPVVSATEVLFHLKSHDFTFTTVDDLAGMTIGGTAATKYPELEEAEARGVLTIDRSGTYDTLFKRLIARGLDAVPMVRGVGNYFLDNNMSASDRAKIVADDRPLSEPRYHLILSKNNPDSERFQELFNKGMKNIKENGVYDKLKEDFEAGLYNTAE